ncbi:gas vesicle protein GvpG [Hyalangium gracile]|uniref:gas vesicle protein GvpG n=1 Tax=Hyalangium gracile TaxID=394092 RepID=UPI0021E109FA|nr:gas vesicle protein GvpG [Hyalangium gracile]
MPFRGLVRVFEEIADRAEKEIFDDEAVKTELMELYARLEAGAVSEEDFAKREAELVERLEQIEEYKKGQASHAA